MNIIIIVIKIEVKCNQLFMPAIGDAPSCYPGGLGEQVLGDKLEIIPFKEMKHGWTVRGGRMFDKRSIVCIWYLDMTDPAVEKDVKKAIKDTLGFLQKNL